MPERIPQSTTIRVPLYAVLSSDHITPATGKTIAVTISKNGAGFGNPSGGATNATEIGSGWYYVDLSTTDTGTLGPLVILGTSATIDNSTIAYNVAVDAVNVIQWLGTAVTAVTAGMPDVNTKNIGGSASVGAAGYAGLDWGHVNAPTTTVALTGTTIATSQVVASVTGTVGSVTGAVGSVTGNVGGNVTGSVGSVVGAVGSVTGNVGGNVTGTVASVVGNVGGNVTGSVGSVVGAVGSVTGAVGSVTGNVGGNVVGSVASVTARVTANTDQWAGGAIPAPNVTGVPLVDIKYTLGTLSQGAAGYIGIDWAKIDNPTATVALTNTTISPSSSPTAAQVATAVWQDATAGDFTVSGSIGKSLFTAGVVPGGSGGLFIAGSNAATTVNVTGNITGNLSGSVGSVTGLTTATISTAVWSEALPGSYTLGEAGYILGNISGIIPVPADIATAVWQDATGSDFTTAGSIGLSLFTGVTPGSQNGLFIAGDNYPTNVTFTGTLKSVQKVIDPVNVLQNQPMPGAANWSVPR